MNRFSFPTAMSAGPTVVFVLLASLIKWHFGYHPQMVLFVVGSALGLFLLEIAEGLFVQKQSIFRTLITEMVFIPLSFFVITSSTGLVGKGLVLAFLLRILTEQVYEYRQTKKLSSWFSGTAFVQNQQTDFLIMIGGGVVFCIEAFLFLEVI